MDADYILFFPEMSGFMRPMNRGIASMIYRVGCIFISTPRKKFFRKACLVFVQELLKLIYLPIALIRYDVFIFSFGYSLLGFGHNLSITALDLWLIRIFRKRIIFSFNGSDVRPDYMGGFMLTGSRSKSIYNCIDGTLKKKKRLKQIEKYSDVVVNIPSNSFLMTRQFVHAHIIGVLNIDDEERALSHQRAGTHALDRPVRILHSPSKPGIKGTPQIRIVIERLSMQHNIEWIEVIDMPHSRVIEELERCDFVVDQLYSDMPMAGFATEAAWYGKPAVVGGYYVDSVRDGMPDDAIPPSLYVYPEEISAAIEKMIVDVTYRLRMGVKARSFVKDKWRRCTVSANWLRIINDDVPPEWYRDPMKVTYFLGAGVSKMHACTLVKSVIVQGGESALQIDDKPAHRDTLVDFVMTESSDCEGTNGRD